MTRVATMLSSRVQLARARVVVAPGRRVTVAVRASVEDAEDAKTSKVGKAVLAEAVQTALKTAGAELSKAHASTAIDVIFDKIKESVKDGER